MAIAYDNATDGGNNGGATNSLTFAHTCSGSDRILYVGFAGDTSTDDITGVTYSGVSASLVGKIQNTSNRWAYLYRLVGPASGSNNVVISCTATHYLIGCATSYTGAAQSGQPDANTTNSASANSLTTSVTTIADNCWAVMMGHSGFTGSPLTAGANTTRRVSDAAFGVTNLFDGNAAVTPAGSTSLAYSAGNTFSVAIMESFAPAGGGGGTILPIVNSIMLGGVI
jgi:hypothetical protein